MAGDAGGKLSHQLIASSYGRDRPQIWTFEKMEIQLFKREPCLKHGKVGKGLNYLILNRIHVVVWSYVACGHKKDEDILGYN